MSEFDANIFVDGQKTVATMPLDGGIVKDGGEIEATCIVEDSNGKRHKAVKIVNVDDEPTIKSEINAQILNNNNELITVTEEQEGEIIPQSNSQIDFHCLVQKDEGEQLSVKTVELEGEIIKTGGAIDTTCIVQGSNGKKRLAVKVFKRGGVEIIETVSGNGSITLPKAKANGLKSVKLFGGCEQSGTPTPTSPQDIISNNGVLKYSANMANVNEQTALIGYYTSAQGVVTRDIYNWMYQAFIPVKPNTTYTLSMSSSVYYVSISEYSTADDSGFIVRKVGSTGSNTQLTITTGANTNFVRFGTNIDRTEVTLEEVLAINWMLNVGNSMAYQPYVEGGIYTDGTVETIQLTGKNLFDKNTALLGDISTSGSYTSRTRRVVSDYIPVRFGQTFVGSGTLRDTDGVDYSAQVIKAFYKADKSYITGSRGSVTGGQVAINDNECAYIRIVFFNQSLVAGQTVSIENSVIQLELGSTATTYAPYYNGGTATAKMLLSVEDYKDIQNVLDGAITRNVGVKVLDGTEDWKVSSAASNLFYSSSAITNADTSNSYKPVSTHFNGVLGSTGYATMQLGDFKHGSGNSTFYFKIPNITTAAECKQWFTNQYNAGTPVIVVYPLATPTTETVTSQTLQVQAGTNVLQITQASIDNLPLEATYKRGK